VCSLVISSALFEAIRICTILTHIFFFRSASHCPRVPQAEKFHSQTLHTVGAETNQSPNDADQDRLLVPVLTKKNIEEHNRQSRRCAGLERSSELRRQQLERFREAARGLGIDFSDQALATMWQGLTPMERFIIGKDN
jgi:hypothetical protein